MLSATKTRQKKLVRKKWINLEVTGSKISVNTQCNLVFLQCTGTRMVQRLEERRSCSWQTNQRLVQAWSFLNLICRKCQSGIPSHSPLNLTIGNYFWNHDALLFLQPFKERKKKLKGLSMTLQRKGTRMFVQYWPKKL